MVSWTSSPTKSTLANTPFIPRKFLEGKHLQTVYNVLFPPDNTLEEDFYCEGILLPTKDATGDHLWLEHNPPISQIKKNSIPWNGYYLVLIHGMEGSSESHYMVSVGREALLRGYGVIRVNLRNCGKGLNLARTPYNAGQSEDLEQVLDYIRKKLTLNIFVSGFSLSANLVLKYFGEKRRNKASAFTATSPPLDLKRSCDFIDSKAGLFYRTHFLNTMKEKVQSGIYQISESMIERVMRARTFFDFDEFFTAPLSGYKNVLEYYHTCSSIYYLSNIKIPGLIIHANDDPVVPSHVWREINWNAFPAIETVLTEQGGHVGFISDPSPDNPEGRWLPKIIMDFFDKKLKVY
ncbi:alpha/beta fold hydrolase [Leptospira ognonensis]|uniref:Alpha/beta fold hydrolase n=1 Tax=Leptospira ognonensis TaxID=2484945 RepID=A0A4R9JYZ4_9LEPT|nr:alpha/beta fold hydrolase [Leptospira ognonensis]TGL57441.1 alpha/beta fold hydrolase [Leptospira ognonensis]